MNEKYYQPSIEEFHVGFQFESETLEKWEKHTFQWTDFATYAGDYVGKGLMENKICVKYLDDEDIESLGFKLLEHKYRFPIYRKGQYIIEIHDNDKLKIEMTMSTKNIFGTLPMFYGKIKNKSELVTLLKQLEI